jgi:hypothetical protein
MREVAAVHEFLGRCASRILEGERSAEPAVERRKGSMLRVRSAVAARCGLVGGDFCGAEVVEFFYFGCGESRCLISRFARRLRRLSLPRVRLMEILVLACCDRK